MRFLAIIFLFYFFCSVSFASSPFTLQTQAFKNAAPLPKQYTCDGKDISPALNWLNAPAQTQSFALILIDPDAPQGAFYHWVLYNIPATTTQLSEGLKPSTGMTTGKNTWGLMQYKGPCPPQGASHHYLFTLYALDLKPTLMENMDAAALLTTMQHHFLGKSVLTAIYSH